MSNWFWAPAGRAGIVFHSPGLKVFCADQIFENAGGSCSGASFMIVKWFLSKTVREAAAEQKHYRRLLAAQRDVL